MKHPTCPNCRKELTFMQNANVIFRFNEEREKYDEVEIDSLSGIMCKNCGENPWNDWEDDETSDLYEKMTDITPPYKFRVLLEE